MINLAKYKFLKWDIGILGLLVSSGLVKPC